MSGAHVGLVRHDESLAVVRLGAGSEVPDWATSSTLLSVTATAEETSVVCAAAAVPPRATSEGPFTAFRVAGTLDFALTGVLSGLLAPLADAGVSVFTISTYDTDWVLVPVARADEAAALWTDAGHPVTTAVQEDPA
ncbi:hypothetical protein GCM10009623_00090 [Nocardioides aestuarii]|uniref:ACT domain-containing protein n=1 Tax=Nocardioides aestuarii TaxID=252231 RepID=A0ABW4TK08_9ACTN